jgi:ABC-2 type transport system ATP-binding protein
VAPPVVEAPIVDAPVVEAPVVDAPVVDAPVVDAAPVVDELPVVEAAPVVDEVPVIEEPAVAEEAPVVDSAPVVDEAPVVQEAALIVAAVDEDTPTAEETVAIAEPAPVVETPAVVLEASPPSDGIAPGEDELALDGELAELATSTPVLAATTETPVAPDATTAPVVLSLSGLVKRFGDTVAVDGVSLDVRRGSFYGIVGPNGAGKTTTLSMVTGLLRPDSGRVLVHGVDAWADPVKAKRTIGVLPDKLRLFDRLTGAQLLYYSGTLRGLKNDVVRSRSADLAKALGIEDALNRLVADYSAGMTKKIALAAAMIHSPRLLVLDEPFESVDPVSAANVIDILQRYVSAGGTVVLSSHGMDLIQRVCDSVAIIVRGRVLAAGTVDEVRGEETLEERFVELAGGRKAAEGMEWLHSFSD